MRSRPATGLSGDRGAHQDPVVALLDGTHLVEDFLDNIGISFDQFRREIAGGWLFGYADALRSAGVEPVLVFVSAQVRRPQRLRHEPSGATMIVLPAPAVYRGIRRHLPNPYAHGIESAAGSVTGLRRAAMILLKQLAPYTSTPVLALAGALRREKCAALICQEYENPRFDVCTALGRLLGIPVFATFQGGSLQSGVLERPVRPLAMRLADGVIIGPRGEAERVRRAYRLPAHKVKRVFNPLDLREWYPEDRQAARAALGLPLESEVVAWHGRVVVHTKGLDILLEAWARLVDACPERNLELILVGTGPDANRLRALIRRLGRSRVTWRDEYLRDRAELRRFLSAADVYAFPSRHEGFPVAPIEAMACGVPVVAAEAPGVSDILPEGERSGGIVIHRRDPVVMAAALKRVLDDAGLRHRLQRAARERAESAFSLEAVGRELREFLLSRDRRVLEGPPAIDEFAEARRSAARERAGADQGDSASGSTDPALTTHRPVLNEPWIAWAERQHEMEQWYGDLVANRGATIACFDHDYKPFASLLETLTGRVLDLGGGAGITRHFLRPETDYVSLDPSPTWQKGDWTALADVYPCLAAAPCGVRAIGEHIPFHDRSFDAVLALWSLNHVAEPEAVVREMARVVRIGGRVLLVMEDMTPKWRDILRHLLGPEMLGWAARMMVVKASCTAGGVPWPVQTDHLRITELDLREWTKAWFRVETRRWVNGYLTFELERQGCPPCCRRAR